MTNLFYALPTFCICMTYFVIIILMSYRILSMKVEEGCSLTTVDDIAAAVHHMLALFQAEAATAHLV